MPGSPEPRSVPVTARSARVVLRLALAGLVTAVPAVVFLLVLRPDDRVAVPGLTFGFFPLLAGALCLAQAVMALSGQPAGRTAAVLALVANVIGGNLLSIVIAFQYRSFLAWLGYAIAVTGLSILAWVGRKKV
jgi:hypothetical protein